VNTNWGCVYKGTRSNEAKCVHVSCEVRLNGA